jgi:EAL domain-containing protein (putative c-di-GMP-specific phosphodiesterase class I)
VTEMERDPKAVAIVNTIVALGRTLNLTITAEGVETPAQARALSEAGCDQAQGFLFGRPISAMSATELVNAVSASHLSEDSFNPIPEGAIELTARL